ncbi:MAG: hypothetical protein HY784_09500 [Chloroflexi bacterium]|nr:hypothetical protein [Chloroflexota bacterium]
MALFFSVLSPAPPLPLVIGVAGGTGSGKTTVANAILSRLGAHRIAYLPHDAYYKDLSALPNQQRVAVNFDHPDSLDNELMIQHIHQLRAHQPALLPIYDFTTHSRTGRTARVDPQPIVLEVAVEMVISRLEALLGKVE